MRGLSSLLSLVHSERRVRHGDDGGLGRRSSCGDRVLCGRRAHLDIHLLEDAPQRRLHLVRPRNTRRTQIEHAHEGRQQARATLRLCLSTRRFHVGGRRCRRSRSASGVGHGKPERHGASREDGFGADQPALANEHGQQVGEERQLMPAEAADVARVQARAERHRREPPGVVHAQSALSRAVLRQRPSSVGESGSGRSESGGGCRGRRGDGRSGRRGGDRESESGGGCGGRRGGGRGGERCGSGRGGRSDSGGGCRGRRGDGRGDGRGGGRGSDVTSGVGGGGRGRDALDVESRVRVRVLERRIELRRDDVRRGLGVLRSEQAEGERRERVALGLDDRRQTDALSGVEEERTKRLSLAALEDLATFAREVLCR